MSHDFGPAVATLEAVLGEGVDAYRVTYADEEPSVDFQRKALESILQSLTLHVPADTRRDAAQLRQRAGGRLPVRVRVTCWVRPDMRADGELEYLQNPPSREGGGITERAHQLVAARILEDLESLN